MAVLDVTRKAPPAAPLRGTRHLTRVEVITDLTRLEQLRPDWLDLLSRSSANEPTLSPDWLLTWWRIFGHSGRRLCAVAWFEGKPERLMGLAPLQRRRYWYRPGLPFRRLEFLASGEREDEEVCSEYLNLLVEQGREELYAEDLVALLRTGQLGAWDELVLPMMDGDHPLPGALTAAFERARFQVHVEKTDEAPYVPLPSAWDEYLRSLPKKHRYEVRRCLRDFEAWAGEDWSVLRAQSGEQLAQGKKILVDLHQQRWEGVGQRGAFHAQSFVQFHDQVMPCLLDQGALELAWLCVRGQPIAVQYNIHWNNKVYFYQCGRRMDLPQRVRAGNVLLIDCIQQAMIAGRREFDFLAGPAHYKRELALTSRPLVQLRAVRSRLREGLQFLLQRSRTRMRSLLKRLRIGSPHVSAD